MWERVRGVLGKKLIERENINYEFESKIKFNATSRGKPVLVVLVEIEHF